VSDANGAAVAAYEGAAMLGAAVVAGDQWSLTLPMGTVSTSEGVDVRVVATDPAGNTTTATRRLRYDDAPPVLALVATAVRDEAADVIAFSTLPQSQYGNQPGYDPTHSHSGPEITLGQTPAPPCTVMGAPRITKHAYLLDETQPAYVSESGGAGSGGRNPLEDRPVPGIHPQHAAAEA
jgi:hypothetical protein